MEHPDPALTEAIDCHYVAPGKAAAFLLVHRGRAAFIDNNTVHAVPRLLEALAARGLTPADVDHIVITHVHLDHAGGTAALLAACPNATVLAHPRAARHVIRPERLIAGAAAVYGEQLFAQLYGEIAGVPEDRVRAMGDGETLDWNGRELRFFETLGHATHHFSIHDPAAGCVYTGDSFGIGRTPAARPGPCFLVCSSTPADFDPPEARASVAKILDTGARWCAITHFGFVAEPETASKQLLRSIGQMEAIMEEAAATTLEDEALRDFCIERVRAAMADQLAWCEVADHAADLDWLEGDVTINAMGIAYQAQRRRKRAQTEA